MRLSRLPSAIGECSSNVISLSGYVNSAQRRLLTCPEAGDESWWGTWAEMVFNVSRANPYITTPRNVARLEALAVCQHPVPIQNQFYEYLQFGNGLLPKLVRWTTGHTLQAISRNNVCLFTDLSNPPQTIRIFFSDPGDENKRVLIQGKDANGLTVYTQDVYIRVEGQFVPLTAPFNDSPMTFSEITGIQKDQTGGNVSIYQVDPVTGASVLLLTMEPSQTTAWYRRYYLDALPVQCCGSTTQSSTFQVKAIAKLDLVPAQVDTDYLLIQNQEAIIEECQSIRYGDMDTPTAQGMAAAKHKAAVGLLNGELSHYMGQDSFAREVKIFGSARLSHQNIGGLI